MEHNVDKLYYRCNNGLDMPEMMGTQAASLLKANFSTIQHPMEVLFMHIQTTPSPFQRTHLRTTLLTMLEEFSVYMRTTPSHF